MLPILCIYIYNKNIWGYGVYIKRAFAEEGDVLFFYRRIFAELIQKRFFVHIPRLRRIPEMKDYDFCLLYSPLNLFDVYKYIIEENKLLEIDSRDGKLLWYRQYAYVYHYIGGTGLLIVC